MFMHSSLGSTSSSIAHIRKSSFQLALMRNTRTGSTFATQISVLQVFIFRNRQTVFYTPSTITIAKGQEITGIISCAPNARNNRDLDISISYAVGDGEEENPEEVTVDYKMCVLYFCRIPFLLHSDLWLQ
jgi:hypothetical protein